MNALKRSPFGRLSEGVLLHIFSFLSTPPDLIRCQATCKSWKSSVAWARPRRLSLACLWAWDHLGCWLADHKALIQHVREVRFTFEDGLCEEAWDIVLLSATRLESLTVETLLSKWCEGHQEIYLRGAQLAMLPRPLTSLCLRDVIYIYTFAEEQAWASVPSGLQLCTLELTESGLPSPLPTCMASLTCLHLWLDFCNESRDIDHCGDSGLDGVVLGCPMLQHLRLVTDRGQAVESWGPLTHLSFLRDLIIEADRGDMIGKGPFPTIDLDAFPAMQSFSAKHCAGVKGHVRGAYIETGYVKSISLMGIRPV